MGIASARDWKLQLIWRCSRDFQCACLSKIMAYAVTKFNPIIRWMCTVIWLLLCWPKHVVTAHNFFITFEWPYDLFILPLAVLMHWQVCGSHCAVLTAVATLGTRKRRNGTEVMLGHGRKLRGGGNPINFKMKFLACFHFWGHYLTLDCSWMQSLLSIPFIPVQLYRLLPFIHQDAVITLYVCRVYINTPKLPRYNAVVYSVQLTEKNSRSFSPYGFYSFAFPIRTTSVLCYPLCPCL